MSQHLRHPGPDNPLGDGQDRAQDDGPGQPPTARDRSIDHALMPDWAAPYLTAAQLALPPVTRWITLFYLRQGLEVSHTAVIQHLALSVAFKGAQADKKAWHSERVIAEKVNLARQTVNKVMGELAAEGWIVRERRPGFSSTCWPSWPPADCLADVTGPERCAAPAKTGKLCTRPAGWGTPTPGAGPCKLHRGVQALDTEPTDAAKSTSEPTGEPTTEVNQTAEGVQPLDNSSEAQSGGWCPTVGQPVVQPEDRGCPTRRHPLSNRWTQVLKE